MVSHGHGSEHIRDGRTLLDTNFGNDDGEGAKDHWLSLKVKGERCLRRNAGGAG